MLLYKLPSEIWIKIFEYDATYHEIYNNIKKEFYTRTKLWRMKNHKTTVFISADSDEEGEGALSIFEIKFNNTQKEIKSMVEFGRHFFDNGNDTIRDEEFITDHFKKSNKVLRCIKDNSNKLIDYNDIKNT